MELFDITKPRRKENQSKALYIGKLSLPADVIQFSWLSIHGRVNGKITLKFISKKCLFLHEIPGVSANWFISVFCLKVNVISKKNWVWLRNEKKLLHKKNLYQQSQTSQSNRFFLLCIVPVDVVFFRNSPIQRALGGVLSHCSYLDRKSVLFWFINQVPWIPGELWIPNVLFWDLK